MNRKIKSLYSQFQELMAQYLPPGVLAFLLPVRLSIADGYVRRGDRQKARRYIYWVCSRRKDIAEIFQLDEQRRTAGGSDGPLTAAMSDVSLRKLLDQKYTRLREANKIFNKLGNFRVGAVLRALLLLRSAIDNIATRKDHGKRHDAILLEIAANDFCWAVIENPRVISEPARARLLLQLRNASEWSLARKISVFINASPQEEDEPALPLQGKSVKLQGPSSRESDLSEVETDLIAVVGYAGPDSLVCPIARVDVSMYLTHKVHKLNQDNRLNVLKDVDLAVISVREESIRTLTDSLVAELDAIYSNVRIESCQSVINGGVELFLWLIGAGASRISITNFDMFINRSYPPGYISNRPEESLERDASSWRMKAKTVGIFALHDPSHQYAIYKGFAHHDEITYDSILDDIISKPLSSYIEEIERTYGAGSIIRINH